MLPKNLKSKFLKLSKTNNNQGIETFATLAGKLENQIYYITTMIMKKGKETCSKQDDDTEEQHILFKKNLIKLGWVRSHMYKLDMSSIDMHRQFHLQDKLPEAIATVISVLDSESMSFQLTEGGVNEIKNCKMNTKQFHHHTTVPPLFKKASHLLMSTQYGIIVEDLRK